MTLIILQYFGLGDIIWGQSIAHHYRQKGYKVLWPVMGEWVEGLVNAYPFVHFIDYEMVPINYNDKRMYEKDGFTYLPMRFSESLMGKPYKFHMESKYSYLGLDWRSWKQHAMPRRDINKEWSLMVFLGLISGRDKIKPYNFIATTFGSYGNHSVPINVGNDYMNVELREVPGYSLFDWCTVIQNAKTIHAVSSSTLYLFELLDLSAESVNLYTRKPIEADFSYTEFLFSKPYSLHY